VYACGNASEVKKKKRKKSGQVRENTRQKEVALYTEGRENYTTFEFRSPKGYQCIL